ncbi:hypothetical protein GIB67_011209 [Kingdonia uniflora]|uniref:Viral late gene transcription factor 3 zinc ribbon domain-containing protein n=1 Tax=Kingdonia uniflora TaxID=39325 RepID=A0A7J7M453_9MAGN|nr:hypothetical protein GIB67_011209 [Kingdonia uniflora]
METYIFPSTFPIYKTSLLYQPKLLTPNRNRYSIRIYRRKNFIGDNRIPSSSRVRVVDEVASTFEPAQIELSWEIIVGTIAGITPFVVAGIEFSKRIAEQRSCTVCKGSGLVLRDKKYYFRCPRCGYSTPLQLIKQASPRSEQHVSVAFSHGSRGNDSFQVEVRFTMIR